MAAFKTTTLNTIKLKLGTWPNFLCKYWTMRTFFYAVYFKNDCVVDFTISHEMVYCNTFCNSMELNWHVLCILSHRPIFVLFSRPFRKSVWYIWEIGGKFNFHKFRASIYSSEKFDERYCNKILPHIIFEFIKIINARRWLILYTGFPIENFLNKV